MAEEQQDSSQKTEEPTQKRLDDSRQKGQVATSREINNWFMLLGGAILVLMLAPGMLADLKAVLARTVAMSYDHTAAAGTTGALLGALIREVAGILALPFGILAVLALIASVIQHPPVFAVDSIKPKLEKISPLKGFKRLFSSRSLVEFVKGILKLAIVGTVATLVVLPQFGRLTQLPTMETSGLMAFAWSAAGRVLIAVLAVMTVIAALDFAYQRMQHLKQMRMSRQDIKDELKQSDGDPMVKARLRQIRTERARQRMMQAVPEATVVVTNPTHFAVALKYVHDEMEAPEVVAKGADLMAARIRAAAKDSGVPLVENPPLARALYASTRIGQSIPPEHYRAVAEVIGFVMRLRRRPGSGGAAGRR